MVQLFAGEGKFHSYHDFERDVRDRKSWYLDRRCHLSPEDANEITQPSHKLERQRGTWTITATMGMAGSTREVELYLFTIVWPSSWYNKGYSTFTIGLETLEEARAWHAAVAESISLLRSKKGERKLSESNSMMNAQDSACPISESVTEVSGPVLN